MCLASNTGGYRSARASPGMAEPSHCPHVAEAAQDEEIAGAKLFQHFYISFFFLSFLLAVWILL